MGDKLDVKIITRSGKTHMLSITKKEYGELLYLITGSKFYVEIKKSTGYILFTKDSIETIDIYYNN